VKQPHLELVDEVNHTHKRIALGAQGVVLGTSSRADVQVNIKTGIAPEHLILSARDEGTWVSVLEGATPLPSFDGRPFRQGVIPWNSEVHLGPLRIKVYEGPPPNKAQGVSRPVLWFAIVCLGVLAWLQFSERPDYENLMTQHRPPVLFSKVVRCPAGDAPTRYRAKLAAEEALAKQERYPFSPHDGVQAILLFERARVCFEASGDSRQAARVAGIAKSLERQIAEDYRAYSLSLERALREGRIKDAVATARLLRAMLTDHKDPYTAWVEMIDRVLTRKLEQQPPVS